MAEQPTAPKTLKLKIRIPALKRDPLPPPSPPPPPPPEPFQADGAPDDSDEDDQADSQSPSQSGSPNSSDQGDDDIETAYDVPSTSASTQPTFTPILKLKLSTASKAFPGTEQPQTPAKKQKKPRARPKLFGRVTERKGPAIGPDGQPVFQIKKPPKLKSIKEILPRLLGRIKKKDNYGIFLEPVDTTAFPHYLDIIKHPMDLSTMERTLEAGRYRSLDQFAADFRLMINNCKTFNPAPSLYHTEASRLEAFGNEAISQAAGQLMDPADEPEPMDIDQPAPLLPAPAEPMPSAPSSPLTMTLSGRTVKKVYHERTRSDTLDSAAYGHTPGNSISSMAQVMQKAAAGGGGGGGGVLRGPYKKTVVRDVPLVGPCGELPGSQNGVGEFEVGSEWAKIVLALEIRGKRYKTKKERLEMEKRGLPTLWDGSIDYAQLEDPWTVLHHFAPDPFEAPWLASLSPNPATTTTTTDFPIQITASHLASRTSSLITRLENSQPAYFVNRGYSTRASLPAVEVDDTSGGTRGGEAVERMLGAEDWGVFTRIEGSKEIVSKGVERAEVEGMVGEGKEAAEYLRDIVYGGTQGLAYTRSLMRFVGGAAEEVGSRREADRAARDVKKDDGVKKEEDDAMADVKQEPDVKHETDEADREWTWEEPPGGLGMSLQEYIAKNVLDPATGGMHGVLSDAADYIIHPPPLSSLSQTSSSTPRNEDAFTLDENPIHTRLSLTPVLRQHLEGVVARRREKINLALLVKDPVDLALGDEVWDDDSGEGDDSEMNGRRRAGANGVRLMPDRAWVGRALGKAADRVDAYARRTRGERAGMEVDGRGVEDEETRKLRFNLLALARMVPLSEGVVYE